MAVALVLTNKEKLDWRKSIVDLMKLLNKRAPTAASSVLTCPQERKIRLHLDRSQLASAAAHTFIRKLNYPVLTRSTEPGVDMADNRDWDPAFDAVVAAPQNHKVIFENERLRVLEVTLEAGEEEPIHHHRWPSVFVFDQIQGPVHDMAPDGTQLPPNRDVMQALQHWNGKGCLVVNMAPQPLGRVLNASGKTIHGIRVEMKPPS